VRRFFASPRRRRRSAWLGGALVAAGALSFVGVHFANTGHSYPSVFHPGPVQYPPESPKPDPFTQAERKQVRAVAVQFISTAVFRDHVDDSWEITAPELRQGFTRTAWATGNNPIVPYPEKAVAQVRWQISYSFSRRVGLKVAFYPKSGADVQRQIFDLELLKVGTGAHPKWLVSGWTPSGGPQLAAAGPGSPSPDTSGASSSIRPVWLLAPVARIVGSLLVLVGWISVRGWLRQSRAKRAYSKTG
jgi:hypothetical protein